MRRICTALTALLFAAPAMADSEVWQLRGPNPDEVVTALRGLYGDAVRVERINDRLLLVGQEQQLQGILDLLEEIDQPPLPLLLTISMVPPPQAGSRLYATGDSSYRIETVEQALVAIDHERLAQRFSGSDGWVVMIDEEPVEVRSLMLQIRRLGSDTIEVLTSFAQRDGDHRRVLGNQRTGRLGEWIPLLPTPAASVTPARYTSSHSDQLWLLVEALERR